ncbi:hypothetical protein CN918_26230 [Priestia megaterium]|nr:hypothetical protein CN918_26230 [Priestia megaterium]
MIHLYGHVQCSYCSKNIRALVEFQHQDEKFIMVGEPYPESLEGNHSSITCEYCFQQFQVTPLQRNGMFSLLANERQAKEYQENPESIPTVEASEGLLNEQHYKDETCATFPLAFSQQPYYPNQTLYLNNQKYRVLHCYKKEHTERETEERLLVDFYDTYYYEVISETKEEKWLKVVDDDGVNAILSNEPPVVLQYETLYNIDDSGFISTHLYDLTLGEHYKASFYQHLSGVQMQIIYHDDHQSVVVVDALEQEIDELYTHIENQLHIME